MKLRAGAQQQRRRVDRAAAEDVVLRLDPDPDTRRLERGLVERQRVEAADLIAGELQLLHAQVVHQLRALLERLRNRRHQHRLLGVDRAAETAVTAVHAAAHVARNHVPVPTELLAAVL
jgi:hypothetical protein